MSSYTARKFCYVYFCMVHCAYGICCCYITKSIWLFIVLVYIRGMFVRVFLLSIRIFMWTLSDNIMNIMIMPERSEWNQHYRFIYFFFLFKGVARPIIELLIFVFLLTLRDFFCVNNMRIIALYSSVVRTLIKYYNNFVFVRRQFKMLLQIRYLWPARSVFVGISFFFDIIHYVRWTYELYEWICMALPSASLLYFEIRISKHIQCADCGVS